MQPLHLLMIAAGGAVGASGRYVLYHLLHVHASVASYWAIGIINIIGCLGIGLLFGWLDARGVEGERLRIFLSWGILGAFTTFSTFAADALELIREGRIGQSLLYVLGSVVIGMALVWLGYAIAGGSWAANNATA